MQNADDASGRSELGLRIISYNLRLHNAYHELTHLAREHAPDIICLQECHDAELDKQIGAYKLGAVSAISVPARRNLAIYYDIHRFNLVSASPHLLQKSTYERMRKTGRERLLLIELQEIASNKRYVIASFHATHLVAPNSLRRQQIRAAIGLARELSRGAPAIIVGDFNYPFFKRGLRRSVLAHGAELGISDAPTLQNRDYGHRPRKYRGYFDYAVAVGAPLASVTTLPFGTSDHAPILVHVHA